jgi:hypothetical protein
MSKDNELWRQFCLERWQNIPRESDCAKNWLIPVREGVGNKENRIDWRKVYLIRDLASKAMFALEKATQRPKRGRRHKVAIPKPKDFFEKGWIDPKDIPAVEEYTAKSFQKISDVGNYHEEIMLIVNFHLEFELLMIKQVNISRMKNLGFASTFIEDNLDHLQQLPEELPPVFVAALKKYYELAVQKEVPVETAAKFVSAITSVMSGFFEYDTDFPSESQYDYFLQFVATVICFIAEYSYGDAYNQWLSTDFSEDETSPTHEFEESLNYLAGTIKELGEEVITLVHHTVQSCIQWINPNTSLRAFNTVLAVIGAVSDGLKIAYLKTDLPTFVEKYVLPFFQVDKSTPIEKLVAINYYFATIFSNLGSQIQSQYADKLIPGIITMASVDHPRVQYHVGQMLLGFCEHLVDADAVAPYLQELLSKLYTITLTTTNDLTREKVIFAISSIVITCRAHFSEVREGVMSNFKNVLSKGNKKDREAVIEALSRIGAGVGDQKESIAGDVESLYAQVVEDFKNDRPAHEELLIKLTEFGITTLGKQFTKYLPIVFPVIHQHAIAEVINVPEGLENNQQEVENENEGENENENENEDDDPEMNDEIRDLLENQDVLVNDKEVSLKTSCVAALGNLVEDLDREVLLPYYDQIHEALRWNVSGQGTLELIVIAAEIYVPFAAKFFPPGMEPEWASKIKPFFMDLTDAYLSPIETEEIDTKERVLTSFNSVLDILVKNSPADEPLIDDDITDALLNMCYSFLEQLYTNQDRDIEELHDYGYEVVNTYEVCCKNTTNKGQFIPRVVNFLGFIMNQCMQQGPSESRWADLCILTTTFEYYGDYFPHYNLSPILTFLWNCRVVDSKYTQQAIAYYLSIYARKYPQILPPDLSPVFAWLDSLLTKEYHAERPFVYDNALLAYGYLIERTSAQEVFMQRIQTYVTYFPPTNDGDIEEGVRCLETLARLLRMASTELLQTPNFVSTAITGLKAAMEMEAYKEEAIRNIIEQAIASLENLEK